MLVVEATPGIQCLLHSQSRKRPTMFPRRLAVDQKKPQMKHHRWVLVRDEQQQMDLHNRARLCLYITRDKVWLASSVKHPSEIRL